MRLDVHTSLNAFLGLTAGAYVGLVVLVAILPAAALQRAVPPSPPDAWQDPLVLRGRELYQSFGCIACHTQQVRGDERFASEGVDGTIHVPVLRPDRRFGLETPTRAEDYRDGDPPFLGTQRTGPDLTNVGARLPSATWHYWHLFAPWAVSPDSNMPGLPWLFHTEETKRPEDEAVDPLERLDVPGGRLYATPDARALVEYLLSLRRVEDAR